jgi:hypothetical protein
MFFSGGNMLNGARAAICGLLVTASVMSGGTVAAEDRVRAVGPTVGVMAGINAGGSTWSGGGTGPVLSLHVEVPAAPTYRARLTLGTMRWTPGNDPLEGGRAAGRVSLSHLTVSAIRRSIEPTARYPVGLYAGAGVGFYRYGIKEGDFDDRNHWGLHGLAGVDFARPDSGLAFRLEFQVHATGGPGHPQIWAVLVPAVSASVGVSKRF